MCRTLLARRADEGAIRDEPRTIPRSPIATTKGASLGGVWRELVDKVPNPGGVISYGLRQAAAVPSRRCSSSPPPEPRIRRGRNVTGLLIHPRSPAGGVDRAFEPSLNPFVAMMLRQKFGFVSQNSLHPSTPDRRPGLWYASYAPLTSGHSPFADPNRRAQYDLPHESIRHNSLTLPITKK